MNRINQADLEGAVTRLNHLTESPQSTYVKQKDGKLVARVGNYHLEGAYGGWKLSRVESESGSTKDILGSGYTSKRELYGLIQAYMHGLNEVKK